MTAAAPLRAGLFGVGLAAYWPQFPGLKERLLGCLGTVEERLRRPGVEVVNLGLVDTPDRAFAAGHAFRSADVDVLFLYVTTYALSSTVLPVVRHAKVPAIVLNLQPAAAIDYEAFNRMKDRTAMTGEWLAFCSACPVPEIANVFRRAGIRFHQATGYLNGDPAVWSEVEAWLAAARAVKALEDNRLGLMGHYYGGMLDVYSDLTQLAAVFGGHMEMIEVERLAQLRRGVGPAEIEARVAHFREWFDIQPGCLPGDLADAGRTSVALDRLVEELGLTSLAYYHMGTGSPEAEDTIASIILGSSLLTARHVPVAGEMEVKNVLAMKLLDALGAGGSFTEYYAIDFRDDIVLLGHDGPGHLAIAEGKIKVRPLNVYHGKVGRGLSVEMSVRHGPVTLLSVIQRPEGGVELLVAEGETVPGPILEIGNTNSRYRFPMGARRFVEAWNQQAPAHHCAVGVGHVADAIGRIGALLDATVIRIT